MDWNSVHKESKTKLSSISKDSKQMKKPKINEKIPRSGGRTVDSRRLDVQGFLSAKSKIKLNTKDRQRERDSDRDRESKMRQPIRDSPVAQWLCEYVDVCHNQRRQMGRNKGGDERTDQLLTATDDGNGDDDQGSKEGGVRVSLSDSLSLNLGRKGRRK